MAEQPRNHIHDLFEIVETAVRNRRQRLISTEQIQTVREYLVRLFTTTRLYLVRDEMQIAQEWDKIRANPLLVDFVLGVSNDIHFQLSGHVELQHALMLQSLAETQGQHTADLQHSQMDADLKERLPRQQRMLELLNANRWFSTLLLMDQQIERVLKYFQQPAASGGRGG